MKKPIPDKAEVAIEYPDKLYMGTFERSSRFEAHLDANGISLTLERKCDLSTQKSVHLHLHYGLFAEILHELCPHHQGVADRGRNASGLAGRGGSRVARCARRQERVRRRVTRHVSGSMAPQRGKSAV